MNLLTESLWGHINDYNVIAQGIYHIQADYGEGIIIPCAKAKEVLSEKAISYAVEDNGFLYFLGNEMDIPLYESLKKRLDICKQIEALTLEQIKDIVQSGITNTSSESDYFGECPPPANNIERVRNGIYYTNENGDIKFAVHEAVANQDLTPTAMAFAVKIGEYLFYDHLTSTVPIYELQKVYPELKNSMWSSNSLCAILNKRFSGYVLVHNSTASIWDQIPKTDSDETVLSIM